MIARIIITTLSGFQVHVYAEMSDAQYNELYGQEIWTNMLPSNICESIIPDNLRCVIWRDSIAGTHHGYKKLGRGNFPGEKVKSKTFLYCRYRLYNLIWYFKHENYLCRIVRNCWNCWRSLRLSLALFGRRYCSSR